MAGSCGHSLPAAGRGALLSVQLTTPHNLESALRILAEGEPRTVPIAGGTDLIPAFRSGIQRIRPIRRLVDVGSLNGLAYIRQRQGGLRLGARTTFTEVLGSPLVEEQFPLVRTAAERVGNVQIRNRATVVGNVVNNAPCADSVPPLLVYDASVTVVSSIGERRVPLQSFLLGPYQVALQDGEMVTEIVLPHAPQRYFGTFVKLGRRRGTAISRITLAVLVHFDSGLVQELRLAAGSVTPVGQRFPEIEALAHGRRADRELFACVSRELGRSLLRLAGERPSSSYKIPVVQQLCYHSLCEVWAEYRKDSSR